MPEPQKIFDIIHIEKIGPYELCYRANEFEVSKKTVVLIHGIGVSSAYYVPFAKQLSSNYNVFALDLPGYGKSPKPSKALTIKELAHITVIFLKKHKLAQTVLIGHSMGCQIIASMDTLSTNMVNKIILLAPTVNHHERTVFMQGVRLMQNTFFENPKTTIVIYSDYIRMGVLRYLKTSRWMVEDHIEDSLKNITIPTLIIRGKNDHIVPHDWVSYLCGLSSHIKFQEIPMAPHAFHYNFAQEAKAICQRFIQK
jgi:pimeloyl-ACP methyl ester carboxylesterase